MINTEILELYSYNELERKNFSYIDKYMRLAESKSDDLTNSGFALAGLFLTFRACNHSGCTMTTQIHQIQFSPNSPHYRRLAKLPELLGIEFEDSLSYLHLAGIARFTLLLPWRHRLLFRIAKSNIIVRGHSV